MTGPSRVALGRHNVVGTRLSAALAAVLMIALLPAAAAAATLTVDGTGPCDDTTGTPAYCTIQAAVDDAVDGDVVQVEPGVYAENVSIAVDLTLRSTGGRDATIISGVSGSGALGAVRITGGTTGVQIGGAGQGFHIFGIDNGSAGVENAAVYFQGNHADAVVQGNRITAQGDHGLITEYGATVSGFVIEDNIFDGKTFLGAEPAGTGFGQQFTLANVPRQLVVMGGGTGGGNTSDVTFRDNTVIGTAGGSNGSGEQGNTLVTIDSAGATISGNTFAGTTTRFATQLRSRGPSTTISGNTFTSAGLSPTAGHVYLVNTGEMVSEVVAANTFDRAVWVEGTTGTILAAIAPYAGAPDGTEVHVEPGTYTEPVGTHIANDVTFTGADRDTVIVHPTGDTGTSGDARGWFVVDPGAVVDVSGMTFDGNGQRIYQAFRHKGSGSFNDVAFTDIQFDASGPSYQGVAIAAFGDGPVDVTASTFDQIGRIGVLYFGTGVVGSLFDGNTYTGKGDGDFLDYALDISAGAEVTVTGNTITDNRGVASSDGSQSAGVLASTFFGAGTSATISGNTISNSTTGIVSGFDGSDTAETTIIGNDLLDNETGVHIKAGTSLLQDNDFSGNDVGLLATDDAVIDAGQVGAGATDFTGLGISTGGNDFSAFPAEGTTAIDNDNVGSGNELAGPQGRPTDLFAQGNLFDGTTAGFLDGIVDDDGDDPQFGLVDVTGAIDATPPTGGGGGGGVVTPPTEEPTEDPVDPAEEPEAERIGGTDRIDTSVQVSQATFADGAADAVVVATSLVPADAVAGTPLSVALNAPLLLTETDVLDQRVLAEIERVLPAGGEVYLLGGLAALSADVEQALESAWTVIRLEGPNRFATAVEVADAVMATAAFAQSDADALLADGGGFTAATVAGVAAAHIDGVVLLTAGEVMPPETAAWLAGNESAEVVAIGPEAAAAFDGPAITADTPEGVAVAVAEAFFGDTLQAVGLATSAAFPDPLAGGVHIAHRDGALLLTQADSLPAVVEDYLESVAAQVSDAFIYGGTAAVEPAVQDQVLQALTVPAE